MSEKRRDVLEGLDGYSPGPWRDDDGRRALVSSDGCKVIFSGWTGGTGSSSVWPRGTANSRLAKRAPDLVDEVRALRAALEHMVCNCIACAGLGELPEAVLAWDVPGAPVPECGVCRDARALLPTTRDDQ